MVFLRLILVDAQALACGLKAVNLAAAKRTEQTVLILLCTNCGTYNIQYDFHG